jgi:hypothetical protein
MTRSKKAQQHEPHVMPIAGLDGDGRGRLMAKAVHEPTIRHATVGSAFGMTNFNVEQPCIGDSADVVAANAAKAKAGDMGAQIEMLAMQAMTLDAVFTSMATRASLNASQFPQVAETYMRLALKAQANSRATIETLTKITRGGEQIIKHIHVDNRGGQAVIAETFHTGGQNGFGTGQPCEPGVAATCGTALSGPNPIGDGMPVPGHAERPMQDSWRKVAGSTEREPQRMASRRSVG